MLRIAVVDDERQLADMIKRLAEAEFAKIHGSVEVISYTSPEQMIVAHQECPFQLAFLDIDMPELNGFQTADCLRKTFRDITIIFVSGYDNFVYESIKFMPFRFIRKSKLDMEMHEAIQSFYANYIKIHHDTEYLIESGVPIKVDLFSVVAFVSVHHTIIVYFANGEKYTLLLKRYSLSQLETDLADFGFIRIHRSYLLNYRYIKSFHGDTAELKLKIEHNSKISVAHNRMAEIRQLYMSLLRGENGT